MNVLGLVPARAGSKGVVGKNARELLGHPLIEWTIRAALMSEHLQDVVVSTDGERLAEIARDAGAQVPFLRPEHLANDTASSLSVVQHAVAELGASGCHYDAVMLLQPTTPFRDPRSIDEAIELMASTKADSVVAMTPVPVECHPDWVYFESGDGTVMLANGEPQPVTRRQDLRPAFRREGSIYLTRIATIEAGSLYGHRVVPLHVDSRRAFDINTEDDWERTAAIATQFSLWP